MTSAMSPGPSATDRFLARRGAGWLRAGGVFGAVGAAVAFAVPALLFALARWGGTPSISFGTGWTQIAGILAAVGAALILVSFVCYRWSFSLFRRVAPRYWGPSGLCLVGSSGLVLVLVATVLATGAAAAVAGCVQGSWTNAFSCLERASPLGAYAGLLGLWLGWIGGIGLTIGLAMRASDTRSPLLGAATLLYAVLLVLLVIPLLGFGIALPDASTLLLLAPAFATIAPILVAAARIPTSPGWAASPSLGKA